MKEIIGKKTQLFCFILHCGKIQRQKKTPEHLLPEVLSENSSVVFI